MPAYIIKELPEDVAYILQAIREVRAGISASIPKEAEILEQFKQEIVRRQSPNQLTSFQRSDVLRDWLLNELNLEQPWQEIKQIRVFTHTVRKPGEYYGDDESVLVLKKIDGKIEVHGLEHYEANELNHSMGDFLKGRRLGVIEQSEIDKKEWDNLSIYSNDTLYFYRHQNMTTVLALFQLLDKKLVPKSHLILDLGSGKGEIGRNYLQNIDGKGKNFSEAYWINVDLSEKNTQIANKNKTSDRDFCIKANGKKFVQNPLNYFDKSLWENYDIYVIASGFLTEGVICFSDSVEIFRALKQNTNVKGILLTGLHASHITPYLAKQMGFERVNINIHHFAENSIEIYQPQSFEKHLGRLLEKMNKHGVLDLSYVANLSEILKALESIDLSVLKNIFLAGVKVSQLHVEHFDRLLDKYPAIKI